MYYKSKGCIFVTQNSPPKWVTSSPALPKQETTLFLLLGLGERNLLYCQTQLLHKVLFGWGFFLFCFCCCCLGFFKWALVCIHCFWVSHTCLHHPKLAWPHICEDHRPVQYICKHVRICWRENSQSFLQAFGCPRLQMDADITYVSKMLCPNMLPWSLVQFSYSSKNQFVCLACWKYCQSCSFQREQT